MLEVRQDDGPDFVTVVEAGLLAKAGMNAAGLGLATNALVTDADVGDPGLPYHVLLRAILDCGTVTEAVEALRGGLRSSSANYLIAHASGSALDIEAAPGDFPGSTRYTPRTASSCTPTTSSLPASTRLICLYGPCRAARSGCSASAARQGAKTLDDFRVVLADHADYPHGICAHPGRPPTRSSRARPSPRC